MDRHTVRRVIRTTGLAFGLAAAGLIGAGQASAAPGCPEGAALTTVTDDFGNTVEACVAQAAPVAAAPAGGSVGQSRPTSVQAVSAHPATGSETTGLLIASGLVASGAAVSLAARRRMS
jgi:LPXTG-motif cell wall-anchored protein